MNIIKQSTILSESSSLRLKSQVNGVSKLQGVFRMKDQEGFPIDMSYELAKENGWEVEYEAIDCDEDEDTEEEEVASFPTNAHEPL